MVDRIEIRGDKAFAITRDFDSGSRTESFPEEEIDSLLPYLNSAIKLSPETTFGDFWKFVEIDQDIYSLIFNHSLGGHNLSVYSEQIKKPGRDRTDENPNNSIHHLFVGWGAESNTYDGKKNFHLFPDFGGWGKHTDDNGEIYDTSFAVEFTPVNDLKDYVLFLKEEIECEICDLDSNSPRERETINLGAKEFTVYDVLNGIFHEMTFVGYPDEQVNRMQELDQSVAEAKANLENLIPFEDIIKELDEEKGR